jgi:hypothetical protein
MHKWKYRNPYDRTCELCDRHEQAFTHAWDLWRVYNEWKYTWWEEIYPPSNKACTGRARQPVTRCRICGLILDLIRKSAYNIAKGEK